MGISIPKLLLILPTRQKKQLHTVIPKRYTIRPFNFRKIALIANTIRETQERSLL
jgi:hypothetical protein